MNIRIKFHYNSIPEIAQHGYLEIFVKEVDLQLTPQMQDQITTSRTISFNDSLWSVSNFPPSREHPIVDASVQISIARFKELCSTLTQNGWIIPHPKAVSAIGYKP